MAQCYNCASELNFSAKPSRSAECPVCKKDVRVCLNCRFYEPGAYRDCRESISDEVREKDRGNFCDWFQFSEKSAQAKDTKKIDDARSKFKALFDD